MASEGSDELWEPWPDVIGLMSSLLWFCAGLVAGGAIALPGGDRLLAVTMAAMMLGLAFAGEGFRDG